MKLSIIIPCFNQIKELYDCLESISKQRFTDFEIIVIDGGSKGNFESILIAIPLKIKFVSEPDSGVYDAMNKGVSMASGDWLYFMGVDDAFYDDDVLKSLIPYFKNDNVKLFIGPIIYRFKKDDSIFVKKNKGLFKPLWSKQIWLKNTLPHQGMFYHRSLFEKQCYDTKYKVLGDYAFNLNLWRRHVPVLIIDTIIATCGTQGLSKCYNWSLYKEEITLKTEASFIIFKPIFMVIATTKFVLKKLF
ncbi:glycosyltransferase family 2 protein [Litoribaculum gwangyangense]|uniref:Glycosyltransferase 2-like domain-containing protein n=1 Tax=Litoribaculum gwangyangense TaxID=1130722 RepID=A0ABP9CRJ9_9FLAO